MIRSTHTTAGSIGRTADGNSNNKPTSKAAAITKICDRRAPGRHSEQWVRVQCREEKVVLWSPRLLTTTETTKNTPLRFQPVDQTERQMLARHAQEVQRFREERQKLEANTAGAPAVAGNKDFVPARVKLPGSPIVAKSGAEVGKDQVPPKLYEAPKPDLRVAAKPRVDRSVDQPQQRTVNKVPLDQPQRQPKAPQPQPKVERVVPQPPPQPQPKVEKTPPPPQANAPVESKQDKSKGKDKN